MNPASNEIRAETHLLDPKRQTWGNWPSAGNWPLRKEIMWDGREPMTLCSRAVRFVVIALPGEASTCRICVARQEAAERENPNAMVGIRQRAKP